MLLHIFTHINTDDMGFTVKQLLRKCLGNLSFTDTGWSQKQKASNRAMLILNLSLTSQNGITDKLQCVILSYDTFL